MNRHRGCSRYRAALVDVVDLPQDGRSAVGDSALLRHVERCRACRDEVERLALTAFAVRRSFDFAATAAPNSDGWARLRRRVERRRTDRRFASSAVGLALSAGLAMAFMVTTQLIPPAHANDVLGESGYQPAEPSWGPEDLADRRWLRDSQALRKEVPSIPDEIDARWSLFRFAEQSQPDAAVAPASIPQVPLT